MHKHIHWITLAIGLALGYFVMPAIVGFISGLLNR
jgi:hypothetical protein